jgi:hypothetical protein
MDLGTLEPHLKRQLNSPTGRRVRTYLTVAMATLTVARKSQPFSFPLRSKQMKSSATGNLEVQIPKAWLGLGGLSLP